MVVREPIDDPSRSCFCCGQRGGNRCWWCTTSGVGEEGPEQTGAPDVPPENSVIIGVLGWLWGK